LNYPRTDHAAVLLPQSSVRNLLVVIGGNSKYAIEIYDLFMGEVYQAFSLSDIKNPRRAPPSLTNITAIAVHDLVLIAGGEQKVIHFVSFQRLGDGELTSSIYSHFLMVCSICSPR
jgi:hypothetical protein